MTLDGLDGAPWHNNLNLQLGQSSVRNLFQVEVFPKIVGISNALVEVEISTKEYGKASIEAILLDFYCGRAPIGRGKRFDVLTSFSTNEERNQDWQIFLDQEVENDRIHRSIKSFPELINTNIGFLKGEIYATPYHGAPIDRETLPLLQSLIEINKFGFISTGGQPAVCEYYYKSPLLESQVDFSNQVIAKLFTEYPDGYYFADEQNGHIEGFLQRDMAMDLIGFVSQRKDVNIHAHDFKTSSVLYTNTPHGFYHSRTKISKSLCDFDSTPWKIFVEDGTMAVDILDAYKDYPRIIKILDDCVGINMYTKTFEEGSPESVLLDFFKGRSCLSTG